MSLVVDTSAVVAVVLGEDDAETYLRAMLASSGPPLISAASVVEAFLVVESRQGQEAGADLRLLLAETECQVAAVEPEHVSIAVDAWRRFGKGRHPAGLSYGDCLAYSLAKARGEPLLFKGDDLAATDVLAAR